MLRPRLRSHVCLRPCMAGRAMQGACCCSSRSCHQPQAPLTLAPGSRLLPGGEPARDPSVPSASHGFSAMRASWAAATPHCMRQLGWSLCRTRTAGVQCRALTGRRGESWLLPGSCADHDMLCAGLTRLLAHTWGACGSPGPGLLAGLLADICRERCCHC